MKDKIIKLENGINIKILTENLCVIYGNEYSSNYFITRKELEKLLKQEWK